MKPYLVSHRPDLRDATEIMASSFTEARDKAEHMGVPCREVNGHDGFYTICNGTETRDMPCEFVFEAEIELNDENLTSELI